MTEPVMIEHKHLDEARAAAWRYWQTLERNPGRGRVTAGNGPVVIVDAQALALTLPEILDDLLGDAGSNLTIYSFGKSYGVAAAQHFQAWSAAQGKDDESSRYGALYWPMHAGLAPRVTILEAHAAPHVRFLIEIADGVLNQVRFERGLDTKPARMFVSGVVSGALATALERPLEARELPGTKESYRIVVAPADILAQDLEDPALAAPVESFRDAIVLEAGAP